MNEELQARFLKYMDSLEAGINKVADFTSAEIPQVIHEYLRWLFIERCVYGFLFLLASIVLAIVAVKFARRWKPAMAEYDSCCKIWDTVYNVYKKSSCNDSAALDAARRNRDHADFWRWVCFNFTLWPTIASVCCFGCTCYQTMIAVKIAVAPRVVLIEHLAQFTGVSKK